MADIELTAGFDTKPAVKSAKELAKDVERELRKIEREADRAVKAQARAAAQATRQAQREMQRMANESARDLKLIFTGVLGAMTIDRAVRASWDVLRQSIRGATEDARMYARIQKDISRLSGSSANVPSMVKSLDRGSRFSEGEIAGAFENLVSQTGDVSGSVRSMNLVLDVAVDRNIDLASASEAVAKAMLGETTQLGRMFPNLKELNRQLQDIQGTSAAAAIMLEAINKQVSGEATADVKTAAGAWAELGQALKEVSEASFEKTTGASVTSKLQQITAEVHHLQDAIERNPKAVLAVLAGGAITGASLPSIVRAMAGVPVPPHPGNIADIRMMDDTNTYWQNYAWTGTPPEPKAATGRRGGGGSAPPWGGFPGEDSFGRARAGYMDDLRGGFSDRVGEAQGWLKDMAESRKESGQRAAFQIANEIKEEREEIAKAIADPIAEGIMIGATEGGEGLKRFMMQTFAELAQGLIKKGITSIIMGALTGGGGAALGGFLPSEALSPVGSMDITQGRRDASLRRTELRRRRLG